MAYSQKAVNDYQKRKYYRLNVTFPAEFKDRLHDAAANRGVSVSRLITDVVGRELGLDLALDGVFPGAKGRADQPGQAEGLGPDGEDNQTPKK